MSASPYVMVTGGAGFLGRAVAACLREEGLDVVVLDRVMPDGPTSGHLVLDLGVVDEVEPALRELLRERGAPAGLVLCHGWSPKGADGATLREDELSTELFRQVVDVNLTSCYTVMRLVAPAMAEAGGGRIVAVGSAAAHTGRTTASTAYAASKAGLAALVRTFAVRYGPRGVLVNDVSPGKLANPAWPDSPAALASYRDEIPAGRLGDAAEVAHVVAFLATERNGYVNGQTLIIDGGRVT